VWPGIERKSDEDVGIRNVVLESLTVGGREWRGGIGVAVQVPHQITFAVTGDAIAKDKIVHPTADINRIDLNVAVMDERGANFANWFVEEQRAPHEAASDKARNF
jgi:hypothetical protein